MLKDCIPAATTCASLDPTQRVNYEFGMVLGVRDYVKKPYTVEEMADMFQKFNKLDRDTLMGFHNKEQMEEIERGKRKKRGKAKENPKIGKAELEVRLIENKEEASPVDAEIKEEGD